MHRLIRVTVALVALGVHLGSAATPLVTGGERILFVGNNITGLVPTGLAGGLDVAVRSVMASGSVNVTTESFVLPGPGELTAIYRAGQATEKIRNGNYDIVVLQAWIEAEDVPRGARDTLVETIRLFDQVITASGAKTVLFMHYPNIFMASRPDVNMWEALLGAIVQSMEAAASRIGGAPIVPVGNVFRTFVRSPYPGTDGWLLYLWCCPSPCCGPEPHGQVPSQYGELLSAYVFYKSLTGLSPVGLRQTYYPGADPKIDSAFQYRAQTLTQRWMELHPATGVRQQAAASPLPVRGAHAPALFLLDGSRYTPGAMGARTPGVLVGSDGRFVSASAVRGRHCRVHPEVSAHHP